jgi:hypothetical protein
VAESLEPVGTDDRPLHDFEVEDRGRRAGNEDAHVRELTRSEEASDGILEVRAVDDLPHPQL